MISAPLYHLIRRDPCECLFLDGVGLIQLTLPRTSHSTSEIHVYTNNLGLVIASSVEEDFGNASGILGLDGVWLM